MDKKTARYQVVDLPPGRRLMANANRLYWQKHFMYGLLEVDVTIVRQFIEEHRARTGEQLSFTGYLQQRYERQTAGEFEIFCHAPVYVEAQLAQRAFKRLKLQKCFVGDDVFLLWVAHKP